MGVEQAPMTHPEGGVGPWSGIPDGGCINYDECGEMTPGGPDSENWMCDACLHAARENGAGHDYGTSDRRARY